MKDWVWLVLYDERWRHFECTHRGQIAMSREGKPVEYNRSAVKPLRLGRNPNMKI